jgi:hypothetical protein
MEQPTFPNLPFEGAGFYMDGYRIGLEPHRQGCYRLAQLSETIIESSPGLAVILARVAPFRPLGLLPLRSFQP